MCRSGVVKFVALGRFETVRLLCVGVVGNW